MFSIYEKFIKLTVIGSRWHAVDSVDIILRAKVNDIVILARKVYFNMSIVRMYVCVYVLFLHYPAVFVVPHFLPTRQLGGCT